MKREDKQIDKLTRRLMEGTTEKPSAELMNRIMKQVVKEQHTVRKAHNFSRPVVAWMVGGLLAYFLLAGGLGYLLLSQPSAAEDVSLLLKEMSPFVAALTGGASLFFFCAQLDNWLRWKRHDAAGK